MSPNIDFSEKKILIVDDDKLWLDLFRNLLIEHFKADNIVLVETPREALDCIKDVPDLDAIVVDYYMPQMEAPELIKKIRKINKDILIVATSSNFFQDSFKVKIKTKEMLKCMKSGANRVCHKKKDEIVNSLEENFNARKVLKNSI